MKPWASKSDRLSPPSCLNVPSVFIGYLLCARLYVHSGERQVTNRRTSRSRMSAIDLLLLLIDIAVIHSGYAADEVVTVMEERAGVCWPTARVPPLTLSERGSYCGL